MTVVSSVASFLAFVSSGKSCLELKGKEEEKEEEQALVWIV